MQRSSSALVVASALELAPRAVVAALSGRIACWEEDAAVACMLAEACKTLSPTHCADLVEMLGRVPCGATCIPTPRWRSGNAHECPPFGDGSSTEVVHPAYGPIPGVAETSGIGFMEL